MGVSPYLKPWSKEAGHSGLNPEEHTVSDIDELHEESDNWSWES
jgi:hypothetical protein